MKSGIEARINNALVGCKSGRRADSVCLFGNSSSRCKKFVFFENGRAPSAFGKFARDPVQERSLESEAEALRHLGRGNGRRHVPKLLHFGRINGWPALITEFCDGYSISQNLVRGRYGNNPRLALSRAFRTACARMWRLKRHPEMSGIHGDICFSNILDLRTGWCICDWEMSDPSLPALWDLHLLCVDAATEYVVLSRLGTRGPQQVLGVFAEEWFKEQCAAAYRETPDGLRETGEDLARSWFAFLDYVVERESRLGENSGDTIFWRGLRAEARRNPCQCAGVLGVKSNVMAHVTPNQKPKPPGQTHPAAASTGGLKDSLPPLISVVVPFYNGGRYLTETLRSAFAQTYRPIEVIVVDDGSPESSEEVLRDFEHTVKIVRQDNQGVAAARNTGIRVASGNYVALLDQDDIWHPGKIARQIAVMQLDTELGLIFCKAAAMDAEGRSVDEDLDEISRLTHGKGSRRVADDACIFERSLLNDLIERCFITSCSGVLFRKTALLAVGLFDTSLNGADDAEIYVRLANKYRIGYVETPLYRYRKHPECQSRDWLRGREMGARMYRKLLGHQVSHDPAIRNRLRRHLAGRHKIMGDYLAFLGRPAEARYHHVAAMKAFFRPISLISWMLTWMGPLGTWALYRMNRRLSAECPWSERSAPRRPGGKSISW